MWNIIILTIFTLTYNQTKLYLVIKRSENDNFTYVLEGNRIKFGSKLKVKLGASTYSVEVEK